MSDQTDPQLTPDPAPQGPPRQPLGRAGPMSPPPPPPGFGPMMMYPPPAPPRRGWFLPAIIGSVLTAIILISLGVFLWIAALVAGSATGSGSAPIEETYSAGDSESRIVILPVTGLIDDSKASFVQASLGELRGNLPKAIVLRVDSGGGTVSASDRIAHLLTQFHTDTKVPIVASFGSLAASGGYYISAGADHIIAEPTTITGSIGVIAEAFTFSDSLTKLGVKSEVVTSTPAVKKDSLNPFRAWTDSDRALLRGILDHAHARFVDTVYEGRKSKITTKEEVAALATGAVYTAEEAIKNKLVDEEGFLEEAINKAKQLASIGPETTPKVNILTPARHFSLLNAISAQAPPSLQNVDADQLRRLAAELTSFRMEYRFGR